MIESVVFWLAGLLLAPFASGIILRVKAIFAGRQGPPLLQPYYDIAKLLRKGAVYSRTTSFVFRAGPVLGLAAVLTASLLVPLGGVRALVAFPGDVVLFLYLLGLLRFITVLAALDTGSSFEGMGASRETWVAALAEPALVLFFATLVRQSGAWSLSEIALLSPEAWGESAAVMLLACVALFFVLLAENARLPVDDPATHLELTMIHEVMVLDHGGVDLAFILYGASLKLWIMAALLVDFLCPVWPGMVWRDGLCRIAAIGLAAVAIGVVESSMARLRLRRISQFLAAAVTLAAIALVLSLEGA